MRLGVRVAIAMLIIFFTASADAGQYVLVKGKGAEVCEAYRKNLNSFGDLNVYTMACERERNPKFTKFKKPDWEEIDLWENRELLKKVERFLGLK